MKSLASKKEYVQPTTKGQITIPASFRRQLAIDPSTLLEATLVGESVVFKPIKLAQTRETNWEPVIDFTDLAPKGIKSSDLKKRLKH